MQQCVVSTKKKSNIKLNSIIAAIMLCFNLINGTIGIDGVSYITIALVFSLLIWGLIRKTCSIYANTAKVVLYIITVFIISFLVVPDTQYTLYYFRYFLGFGIIAFIAGQQNFVIEDVLSYIEIIGAISITIFFCRGFDRYDASLKMGISYSFLTVLFAALITLRYSKQRKIIPILLIVSILGCYIMIAPRGIWVTIGISLLLYYYIMLGKRENSTNKIIIRGTIATVIIGGGILLFQNLFSVLSMLRDLVYSITNTRVYALDKAIWLLSNANATNGRDTLALNAREMISSNFIFGNGIGAFEVQNYGLYVHNIFYQALCEAGIFFLFPTLCIMLYVIRRLLKPIQESVIVQRLFLLMLFSNGFIILFYSSVYWQLLPFWFLIGFLLNYNDE